MNRLPSYITRDKSGFGYEQLYFGLLSLRQSMTIYSGLNG